MGQKWGGCTVGFHCTVWLSVPCPVPNLNKTLHCKPHLVISVHQKPILGVLKRADIFHVRYSTWWEIIIVQKGPLHAIQENVIKVIGLLTNNWMVSLENCHNDLAIQMHFVCHFLMPWWHCKWNLSKEVENRNLQKLDSPLGSSCSVTKLQKFLFNSKQLVNNMSSPKSKPSPFHGVWFFKAIQTFWYTNRKILYLYGTVPVQCCPQSWVTAHILRKFSSPAWSWWSPCSEDCNKSLLQRGIWGKVIW